MSEPRTLGLFEGFGIEIEYAIVDSATLDVRPIADEALRAAAGGDEWTGDFEDGPIAWSNELVRHVLEAKTNGPVPSLEGVAGAFYASMRRVDTILRERFDAQLVPGAMHPWMDPAFETQLWPHEYSEVYGAFDKIYDCRRHGWANVQSVHVNLPFKDEEEFARLMAAIRIVLPLVPALAAASPIVESKATGRLDSRLEFYRTNSKRTPAMAGEVIPEPIFDIEGYRERVLGPIQRELKAVDTDGILHGREWSNARGAIARFDRNAIEIRLIDAQERPSADLAVAAAVSGLVKHLVDGAGAPLAVQQEVPSAPLVKLLARCVDHGPNAPLEDSGLARLFDPKLSRVATTGELVAAVVPRCFLGGQDLEPALEVVLREGTLAQRILSRLGDAKQQSDPRERLREVWSDLADCLIADRPFHAARG